MTMLKTYKERLEISRKEHIELLPQMERAGISSKGDYINQIEVCERNIKFYEKKIQELQSLDMPISANAPKLSFTEEQLFNKAQHAFELDEYDKAEQAIREALSKNPQNANFHHLLGQILYNKEAYKDAIESFLNSIAIENSFEANYNTGLCYDKLSDYIKSVKAYKKAICSLALKNNYYFKITNYEF